MSAPPAFTAERKRRLVDLLIEAFAQDIQQREEELLDVLTRPAPPLPRPLGYTDTEPDLRMALSNLTEDRRLLQQVEQIPETSTSRVEVFSVVLTRQGERETWYFITPCRYHFEREIRLEELRVRCVPHQHFLVGTPRGHVYSSGGSWDIYTGQMFEAPLEHRVVEIS